MKYYIKNIILEFFRMIIYIFLSNLDNLANKTYIVYTMFLSLLYIYMLSKLNILFYFNGKWNNAV